jgi:hypothetical protein
MSSIAQTFDSLETYYAADARRRHSRERDVGLWWRDAHGRSYRAAWVRDTGELYLFEHVRPDGEGGLVHLLVRRFDEADLGAALAGWREACRRPRSLDWLLDRAGAALAAAA